MKEYGPRQSGRVEIEHSGDDGHWPYSVLHCPACQDGYLHSKRVTVFDRGGDEELLTRTEVENGLVASQLIPSALSGNPSERRHGIAIGFSCENCTSDPELTIAQHKGMTHLAWRWEARPYDDDTPVA